MIENKEAIYNTIFDMNNREDVEQRRCEIIVKDSDGNDVEVLRVISFNKHLIGVQDYIFSPEYIDDDGDMYDSFEKWTLDIPVEIYSALTEKVGADSIFDNFALIKLMKDNDIDTSKIGKWFIKRIDIKSLTNQAKSLGYIGDDKENG